MTTTNCQSEVKSSNTDWFKSSTLALLEFLPGFEESEGRGQCLFHLCFHSFSCFRNPPRFPFPEHHLATDASLYLRLFTMSGNVAARLFWRGRAASYLTDLPMKSQMHSISPQRHAKVILTTHGSKPPPVLKKILSVLRDIAKLPDLFVCCQFKSVFRK